MTLKNSKIYKTLGVIVIILLFFYSLYRTFLANPKPPAQNVFAPNGMNIQTGSGLIPVKDFTKSPIQQVGNSMLIAQTANFEIVYFAEDQAFLISLLAAPLQQTRQAAEQEFLKLLQIDETNACRLKVSLAIPYDISPNLSGQDYGLSFCPTGKLF